MKKVNAQKGEAVIGSDGKRNYLFRFDFDFIATLEHLSGVGAFAIQDRFVSGAQTTTDVLHVVMAALHSENGEPVTEADREAAAKRFMQVEGLEESYAVAIQFLSAAMIGDRKKSLAEGVATLEKIAEIARLSPSLSYKKPLLLMAWRLAIFGLLICTAIKTFGVLG